MGIKLFYWRFQRKNETEEEKIIKGTKKWTENHGQVFGKKSLFSLSHSHESPGSWTITWWARDVSNRNDIQDHLIAISLVISFSFDLYGNEQSCGVEDSLSNRTIPATNWARSMTTFPRVGGLAIWWKIASFRPKKRKIVLAFLLEETSTQGGSAPSAPRWYRAAAISSRLKCQETVWEMT